MNEVWHLHHGDELAADLHVERPDFPWLEGLVMPGPAFPAVAPLFAEEARLLDELAEVETPEWIAAYRRVREATRLTKPTGEQVPEYLLHIEGDRARWRWSDEPFYE